MSALPQGWECATVGEVGRIDLGRQRSPKWHNGHFMRPYLRVANVFEDRIDLSDVKEMDFPPDQYERFKLEPGDILLNEGQSPEWVGRPAMYRGELPGVCFTNSLIRFRPYDGIDGRFALYLFRHHLHTRRFMREARITTNIAHLSATRFAFVEFPVPPVAEQQRIVAAIDGHRSFLDGAAGELERASQRLNLFQEAVEGRLLSGNWPLRTLAEVSEMVTDGDHRPPPRVPVGVPHLTAKNVRGGRLVLNKCTFVSEAGYRQTSARYRPIEGDVIVTCVGTVGAVAVVPEGLRFSADRNLAAVRLAPDGAVRPAFVAAVLSTRSFGRVLRAASGSTAQPHLYLRDLRAVEIPVPPIAEQDALLVDLRHLTDGHRRLDASLGDARRRGITLRRSILAAAFAGKLVPQDPDDEPASALLARIRTEREAEPPVRRARRGVQGSVS